MLLWITVGGPGSEPACSVEASDSSVMAAVAALVRPALAGHILPKAPGVLGGREAPPIHVAATLTSTWVAVKERSPLTPCFIFLIL